MSVTIPCTRDVYVTYLGGQVEPEIAVVGQTVLDEQRHLVAEAKLDLTTEARSFAEVDKVLERESKGHGLSQADFNVLLLVLDVGVLAEGNGSVADVTSAGELYTFLCAFNGDCDVLIRCVRKFSRLYKLTRLRQSGQIPSDLGELGTRHGNSGSVLSVRDTKVLLINVHELDIILAQPVALGTLEDQVDDIRRILGLEGQDVFVLCAAQDFCEGGEIDAERKVAVAAERREGFGLEHHGDKGDVGVVHGLERDSRVIAVEVAVLHEILDGIDDLGRESVCAV
jgi:hypothetical protein